MELIHLVIFFAGILFGFTVMALTAREQYERGREDERKLQDDLNELFKDENTQL